MAIFGKDALGEEINEYWDERATSYSNGVIGELTDDRHVAWRSALEQSLGATIAESAAQGKTARALDLGCGPGFFSILLAEMGCEVDAVDASGEMLDHARANVRERGQEGSVTFHQGDVAALPFADGEFDIVANRNLTWLMRDPEAAYTEWLRVLRPGGRLVVFDANWYLYLFDPEVDAQRHADQDGRQVEEYGEDARATTAEERRCEQFALDLPLSSIVRPAWDLEVLPRCGAAHVQVDEGAWTGLWTASEARFYESSPLFKIEVVKGDCGA